MSNFDTSSEVISWLEYVIELTQDNSIKESYQQSLVEIKDGTKVGKRDYLAACYLYHKTHPILSDFIYDSL